MLRGTGLITHNFCINLERRLDRWVKVKKMFSDHNLQVHRWNAIDAKEYGIGNPRGAYSSHMCLLYFLKSLDIQYALILEDDVVLCNNFLNKLNDVLSEMPSNWDALSLHSFKAKTQIISNRLCRLLSLTYGNHAVLINRVGINKILKNHNSTCIEQAYFESLDNYYAVNLDHTMAFQTGDDSDIPETSIINEYKAFYDQHKHLHS